MTIIYKDLTHLDLHKHLNACVTHFSDTQRAELILNNDQVEMPIKIQSYRSKPRELILLLRSGDFGRKNLAKLKSELTRQGYDLKVRKSAKQKLLSNIAVRIPLVDNYGANKCLRIVEIVETIARHDSESNYAVKYFFGSDLMNLPGNRIVLARSFIGNIRHSLGYVVGYGCGSVLKIFNFLMLRPK